MADEPVATPSEDKPRRRERVRVRHKSTRNERLQRRVGESGSMQRGLLITIGLFVAGAVFIWVALNFLVSK